MSFLGVDAPAHIQRSRDIEVWPENWPVWLIWVEMEHRWLIAAGLAGERRLGLDMRQAESVMNLSGISGKQRRRIYRGLRVMEEAALAAMYGGGQV